IQRRVETLAEGDAMIIEATSLWPHQVYALKEITRRIEAGERRILETTPTGGGKSAIMCGLIERYVDLGWHVVVYTNRRLLIEQLSRVVREHGIEFGVRASGHEDRRELPVQIASLQTERARVLNSKRWQLHGQGEKVLALVDEAHLNAAGTAEVIL